jgi:copper chaperone
MIRQAVFKVNGMSCGHCKMTVEKALIATQGVRDAVVDLNAKTVKVTYVDDKVNLDNMEQAIVDAGYQVVK